MEYTLEVFNYVNGKEVKGTPPLSDPDAKCMGLFSFHRHDTPLTSHSRGRQVQVATVDRLQPLWRRGLPAVQESEKSAGVDQQAGSSSGGFFRRGDSFAVGGHRPQLARRQHFAPTPYLSEGRQEAPSSLYEALSFVASGPRAGGCGSKEGRGKLQERPSRLMKSAIPPHPHTYFSRLRAYCKLYVYLSVRLMLSLVRLPRLCSRQTVDVGVSGEKQTREAESTDPFSEASTPSTPPSL